MTMMESLMMRKIQMDDGIPDDLDDDDDNDGIP